MSKKKKPANHYVDNEKFFEEMSAWKLLVIEAQESDEPKPPVNEYIGKCFLDIAEHLSYRPNFMNYAYREEMIGDGIENCLMYAHNFNPEKSKNPFSYFTQIIYYAFLRRIQKEKKQIYIKYKLIEEMDKDHHFPRWVEDTEGRDRLEESEKPVQDYLKLTDADIDKFTPKKEKARLAALEAKRKSSRGATLDSFLGNDNEDSTDK